MDGSSDGTTRSAITPAAPPVAGGTSSAFALGTYQRELLAHRERPDLERAVVWRVHGVEPERLARAVEAVLTCQEALRLQVDVTRAQQRLAPALPSPVERVDLGEVEPLDEWLSSRRARPLCLEAAGYDCVVLRLGEREAAWFFRAHALLLDSPSFERLQHLVVAALGSDMPPPAEPPRLVAWMQSFAQAPAGTPLLVPLEPVRPFAREPAETVGTAWSDGELRAPSGAQPSHSECVTAQLAYLHRITGNRALALRLDPPQSPQDAPLGPLVAERYLRFEVEEDDTFASLHERVADTLRLDSAATADSGGLMEHLAGSLAFIAKLPVPPDGIVIHARRLPSCERAAASALSPLAWQIAQPVGHELPLQHTLQLCARFFAPGEANELRAQLEAVQTSALANPLCPVAQLPLLAPDAQRRLLAYQDQFTRAYPANEGFLALFEAQVRTRGEAPAVHFGDASLTYAELSARANRLARQLQAMGAGRDTLVGLCLDRSLDLVVAIVAVLEAGAAYVPLDPKHPAERLGVILDDAAPAVLLSTSKLEAQLAACRAPRLLLDRDAAAVMAQSSAPLEVAIDPAQLAYVIFTSGSTGRPKGVQIPHRALNNFLRSMAREPGMGPDDVVLALTTVSFDIHVLELLLPLTVGAQTVVADQRTVEEAEALKARLARGDITLLQATPATWRLLIEAGWQGTPTLKALTGGEALTPSLAAALRPLVGALWNMYGPTETTVWSSVWRVDRDAPISVGVPIDNTRLYVLDPARQLLPEGAAGELWIGGDGLSRGYRGRDDLTTERFVSDPFSPVAGARMYRTGDLARLHPDGTVQCLGRVDHQVKIRGYRIELGEVEAVLTGVSEVSGVAVVVREDRPGDPRLAAYYTAEAGPCFYALRDHAQRQLPPYMVPAYFEHLETLPLTPNGKIDRRALPEPSHRPTQARVSFMSLHGDIEQVIARTFASVLGMRTVGATDNFFAVGGTSLLAVRAQQILREQLDIEVPLGALFEQPTVRGLARILQAGTGGVAPTTVALRSTGSRTPVFCVLGIHLYQALADALADLDRPWYGTYLPEEALLFEGTAAAVLKVETLASHYVEAIRRRRPQGPYCLLGFSFGGLLAFEVAKQLVTAGESVEQLILLDSVLDRGLRTSPWARLKQGLRGVLGSRPTNADPRLVAYDDAQRRYENGDLVAYPGPLVFVHALESGQLEGRAEHAGYGDLASQVTALHVQGDHLSLLGERVADLASALRPLL